MTNVDGMFKIHSQEEIQKLYEFHKKCYEECLTLPKGKDKRYYGLMHHNDQMNWAVRLGAVEK
jgi:hypothetical protein